MSYQTEFPGFVLDVTIPDGFVDQSWHNDACPCFVDMERGLTLFVDDIDLAKRDVASSFRFILCDMNGDVNVETDDWSVIVHALDKQGGI